MTIVKNKPNPLVSIIIPTFNRVDLITDTLLSVQSQSYSNWECIIVDDGSTDGSEELIKKLVREDGRFIFLKRNRGPKGAPTCRNIGYHNSTGAFINWFDMDDIMSPDMIEKKMGVLIGRQSPDFVVCMTALFEGDNLKDLTNLNYKLKSEKYIADHLSFSLRFYTNGPMFRRDFLEQFDKHFDEELIRHQESEFFFRLLCESDHYETIEEHLIKKRIHSQALGIKYVTKSTTQINKNDLIFREKLLGYCLDNPVRTIKKEFDPLYQLALGNLALAMKIDFLSFLTAFNNFQRIVKYHQSIIWKIKAMGFLPFRLLKWITLDQLSFSRPEP